MKVVVYGVGDMGTMLLGQLVNDKALTIVAVVDGESTLVGQKIFGFEVQNIEVIKHIEYDKVYVAIVSNKSQMQVVYSLCCLGVAFEKIEFVQPEYYSVDRKVPIDVDRARFA